MNRQSFLEKYGSWAVITGASDGIGQAFAEQLAAWGMNVALVARRGERLQELASEIRRKHGVEALVIASDLSVAEERIEVEQRTTDLDVGLLVAAAGFGFSAFGF